MASPAMAPVRAEGEAHVTNGNTVKIRRETLLWAATVIFQVLAMVYSYGRLSERVDDQGKQLENLQHTMERVLLRSDK